MIRFYLLFFCCVLGVNLNAQIEHVELLDIELSSGTLLRVSKFPSKYITPRDVDIWLPEGYFKGKKFAVLYMHDGQMLFDASTTWNHQEWMVDEVASELMKSHKTRDFIVVAIHNISETRYADLFPQKAISNLNSEEKEAFLKYAKTDNPDLVFEGDNYLKYLVEEIKPYIDRNFSTLKDRDNTFVSGSSMGGLISWYAICEYPEVFGGAACISTHWPGANPELNGPFPEAFFSYIKDNMPDPKSHKIYFDFGTKTLDQYYPKYEADVNMLFQTAGYTSANFMNKKFEGADHSEASWQTRLYIPFTFLMSK
ncbi:alpha/beta hydrolase [Formosa sp. PL04]|uniref:alpha/beta hydrolase n=1 Tax=Formosa sp. PL04 TaxID=3081755 RepID=UPI0029819122|nr:alpha/beta hydrolase-fold protein [Formosa sp. PL04]MDW5287994.1 alpha/beta hydrolase-fold protein [Formosa sp. PL04]